MFYIRQKQQYTAARLSYRNYIIEIPKTARHFAHE